MSINIADARPNLGAIILTTVDKAIESRYEHAVTKAARMRKANPAMGGRALARRTCRRYAQDLAAAGALAGATSAAPGVGVPAGLATMVPEMAYFTFRSVDMILVTAALTGHDLEDIEERRFVVLAMLAGTDAWATAVNPVVGNVAKGLGAKTVKAIPTQSLRAVNKALGRQILVKYGTKQGVIRLGRLAPLGIGAALGGGVNYAFARGIASTTLRFFNTKGPNQGPSAAMFAAA